MAPAVRVTGSAVRNVATEATAKSETTAAASVTVKAAAKAASRRSDHAIARLRTKTPSRMDWVRGLVPRSTSLQQRMTGS